MCVCVCVCFYECGPVRVGARAQGCTGGRCFYECGPVRGVHMPGGNSGAGLQMTKINM